MSRYDALPVQSLFYLKINNRSLFWLTTSVSFWTELRPMYVTETSLLILTFLSYTEAFNRAKFYLDIPKVIVWYLTKPLLINLNLCNYKVTLIWYFKFSHRFCLFTIYQIFFQTSKCIAYIHFTRFVLKRYMYTHSTLKLHIAHTGNRNWMENFIERKTYDVDGKWSDLLFVYAMQLQYC